MAIAPNKPLSRHEHELAALLFACGPLSRRDIVERTGTHPNLVGNAASQLIRRQIAREVRTTPSPSHHRNPNPPAGRPRLPLEIDPTARHVLGIAIRPGQVSATRLNLLGQPLPPTSYPETPTRTGPELILAASLLLHHQLSPATLAAGVTVPGFVDIPQRQLLLSAASPETRGLDLTPLYAAAEPYPLLVHNDMHALAARWQLSSHAPPDEDVLLAWIADGSIGASILLAGRPNRGCITGAAELGHWQTHRPTRLCFCGRRGCLERIFSSDFLSAPDLATPLATTPDPSGITTTLATALADAANLIRPHRIVIASPFADIDPFRTTLTVHLRAHLLPGLTERTTLDWWPQPTPATAETAAWLALASLYRTEWAS